MTVPLLRCRSAKKRDLLAYAEGLARKYAMRIKREDVMDSQQFVYDNWIKPFAVRSEEGRRVGMELEYPISCGGKTPDRRSILGVFHQARRRGFRIERRAQNGDAVLARGPGQSSISLDSSYLNFEFSLRPTYTVAESARELESLFSWVQEYLKECGDALVGEALNREALSAGESRRILYRHDHVCHGECEVLRAVPDQEGVFRTHPYFFTVVSSAQNHYITSPDRLPALLNCLFDLDFLLLLLFANSPMVSGGVTYLDGRYRLYRASGFGRLGVTGSRDRYYRTVEDVAQDYLSRPVFYEVCDGEPVLLSPEPLDSFLSRHAQDECKAKISSFFSYKNAELSEIGTVEHRVIDTQPLEECMTPAAFCYGLIENLDAAQELLSAIHRDLYPALSNNELCDRAVRRDGAEWFAASGLPKRLGDLLELAERNLSPEDRNYLRPLEKRIQTLHSPAWCALENGRAARL